MATVKIARDRKKLIIIGVLPSLFRITAGQQERVSMAVSIFHSSAQWVNNNLVLRYKYSLVHNTPKWGGNVILTSVPSVSDFM